MNLKDLRFGTEIEFTGLARSAAASAVASVIGGRVEYRGGHYDETAAVGPDGRAWSIVSDGSVTGSMRGAGGEFVTPICTWSDMETLQAIVRALRAAGAYVDRSCGQHVHVDGAGFAARPAALKNLVNLHERHQARLLSALAVSEDRLDAYCQPLSASLLERIRTARPTMAGLNTAWFGGYVANPKTTYGKYHNSRYHALNLYSFFYRGTVEFRHFNGTMHAGEVKANVCLALAMVAQAQTARTIAPEARTYPNSKYEMGMFLKRAGLIGAEFATVRAHLCKRLPGRAASGSGAALAEAPAPAASEHPAVADMNATVWFAPEAVA